MAVRNPATNPARPIVLQNKNTGVYRHQAGHNLYDSFFGSRRGPYPIMAIEFFYNYQQHKIDRSGRSFLPFISLVKFVLVTDKLDGVCYQVFLLIICIKRTDMSRHAEENKT